MLNRLYIIIGVLAILALAAAFVVPIFIPWSEYRDRMEAIAGEVLGTNVNIDGDISFTLLPQPQLKLTRVSAGPAEIPNLTVASVEADFSLIDFLRDRYVITRLELIQPEFSMVINETGSLEAGLAPPDKVSAQNVFVADATISGGSVQLEDVRSGQTYSASAIVGDLRLDGLKGPFAFQGRGVFDGTRYGVRITTGALDSGGETTVAASVQPADQRMSLTLDGMLQGSARPEFSGTVSYRQAPPPVADEETEDVGRGDLTLTADISADADKLVLTNYVLTPDENRAAMRLQGAADITLGQEQSFSAVISGAVLALPPRDATAEDASEPYELIRLLRELPAPPVPGIAGTIGVDIAEIDLRAAVLRNVRIDARSSETGWTIDRFAAQLPGNTELALDGTLTKVGERPEFSGRLTAKSERLDALATLWRKPPPGNPLFGMPGTLAAKVALVGETLSVSDAALSIDGESRRFDAQIGFGTLRDLHLSADLGQLDADQSAALYALLPASGDTQFAATFPAGEFDLTAEALTLLDLPARDFAAAGSWDGGVVVVDELSAADFGGVKFTSAFTAFGSLATPELSGTASLAIAETEAPAVDALLAGIAAPDEVARYLKRSLPAEIELTLAAPDGKGAQTLTVAGGVGVASVRAEAALDAGLLRALSGNFGVTFTVRSAQQDEMMAQLGLPDLPMGGEGAPLRLVGEVKGNIASTLDTTVLLAGGDDSIGFSGDLVVSGRQANSGRGNLKANLSSPAALLETLGIDGLNPPGFEASATLAFSDGMKAVELTEITGTSGDSPFSGELSLSSEGEVARVSGRIETNTLELPGVLAALAGPAALIPAAEGPWPDGPIALGDAARGSAGRIAVTSQQLTLGETVLTDAAFELDWDATSNRLRDFSAGLGDGKVTADLTICCAGPLSDKQVSGRARIEAVDLDAILPAASAAALDGTADGAVRIEGTGASVRDVLSRLTGEGTFDVNDLVIARINPTALASVTVGDNLLELEPADVQQAVITRLDDGAFRSPQVTGGFTIAGGVVRSANLAIEGDDGRLFGSAQVALDDLGLGGSYLMTPATAADETATAGEATLRLGGTLEAPELDFDVARLVDAIMVKAYEAEVARLEELRAEDEARRQAEAEAEAQRQADERAAREAAEAEAAREAAAAQAAREAQEDAQQRAEDDLNRPLDLGLGTGF